MTSNDLIELIKSIVTKADKLSQIHCGERYPVNYACVFCQSEEEYNELAEVAGGIGSIVDNTHTGPVYLIDPVSTVAGPLRIIKIRKPDSKRTERGDADFTVSDYQEFKKEHLGTRNWNMIERTDFEMMELIVPGDDVLCYYSHPTLMEVLGIK